MTSEQFAYWLQGYAELSGDTPPTPEQWASIREHLQLVFTKVTRPTTGFGNRVVSDGEASEPPPATIRPGYDSYNTRPIDGTAPWSPSAVPPHRQYLDTQVIC